MLDLCLFGFGRHEMEKSVLGLDLGNMFRLVVGKHCARYREMDVALDYAGSNRSNIARKEVARCCRKREIITGLTEKEIQSSREKFSD